MVGGSKSAKGGGGVPYQLADLDRGSKSALTGAFCLRMYLFTDDQDVHMRQQILKVSVKMLYVETIVRYSLR